MSTKNPKSDGTHMNEKPSHIKKDDESIDELTKSLKKENDQHYSTDTEE
ncbi:hypothetical protein SAMN05192588_2757 [Nonlabens sp. Hel1_33_55]|nr:hypothetical protein [Nonlabens sp. Hel1_33_55]SCY41480.1 hypothetical protein SAMN05192588_2757 [Nonlabens sp. Hel1_33_55]